MMMKPQLNLNGTSRDELIQSRLDVTSRLDAVLEELRKLAPHGRDYAEWEEYKVDLDIYRARMNSVRSMIEDLVIEASAIQEQGQ